MSKEPTFYGSDDQASISLDSPCARIRPDSFEQRVERVGDRVFCAIGYALSNVTMVAVEGGKVIVDATESVTAARSIKFEFDQLVPGPVKALILTHSHPDHILGGSVFLDEGTEIWAQENYVEELRTQLGILSRIVHRRASKQFGSRLPDSRASGGGIGPALRLDSDAVPPILFPTRTFRDRTELVIGGTRLVLVAAPGETRDHLFVHLPDDKTVLAGDNIYRAFPNLQTIRGAPPRPVMSWIQSLDKIRRLEPEFLALGHTEPIRGGDRVQETLTVYRDAIAYLYANVLKRANDGALPDEIVGTVHLADHLRHHPYLAEKYGTVEWAIRGIFQGHLGWFDGNPSHLRPLSAVEHGKRLLQLGGGRERVEQVIVEAIEAGDPQWAAELCDELLAVEPNHAQATCWKARSLELLGEHDTNVLARNYYWESAAELRGTAPAATRAAVTLETLKDVPIDVFIQSLPLRLRSDRTAQLITQIGFDFTDSGKQFTFYIRRGVGEIRAGLLDKPEFVVSGHERDFKAIASGRAATLRAVLIGTLRCSGGWHKLRFLRSILDPV